MDFKRIERIFIIVFFALNVFLLYTYAVGNAERRDDVEKNISDNIEEELKSEDITFTGELSTEVSKGYYLSAVATDWDSIPEVANDKRLTMLDKNQSLTGYIEEGNQPEISSANMAAEAAEFVSESDVIYYGKDYNFLSVDADANQQLVFYQSYDGLPIYDDTSKLTLSLVEKKDNLRIVGYTATHIDAIAPLREKQDMISEKDAIITLFVNNKFTSDTKIKWSRLGYVHIYTVNGKFVYAPAWLVAFEASNNNLQIERVNAFTNSIISASVIEVE